MSRRIMIEILGDSAQLERTFKRASAATNTFGRDVGRADRGAFAGAVSFQGLGRSVAFASAQFLGAYGLTHAIRSSLEAGMDLQAQQRRTSDVFDHSSKSVSEWAVGSARSMGIAKSAALEAADTVGTLLENVGKTPAKAAEMSKAFVQLAIDEAAFKKVKPEVALSTFEAALAGRTRGLKNFGIVVDQIGLKNEAISEGLIKPSHTGQLNAAQKTLAMYGLLLKETAGQQGTFARSTGEATIQAQIFHASIKDTAENIGTVMIPAFTKAELGVNAFLSSEKNQKEIQHDVAQGIDVITKAAHGLYVVAHFVADSVGGWKHAFEILLAMKAAKTLYGWSTAGYAVVKTFQRMAATTVASTATASTAEVSNNAKASISWEALTTLINTNTKALERNALTAKLTMGTNGVATGGFLLGAGRAGRAKGAVGAVEGEAAAAGLGATAEEAGLAAAKVGGLRLATAGLVGVMGTAGLVGVSALTAYELGHLVFNVTGLTAKLHAQSMKFNEAVTAIKAYKAAQKAALTPDVSKVSRDLLSGLPMKDFAPTTQTNQFAKKAGTDFAKKFDGSVGDYPWNKAASDWFDKKIGPSIAEQKLRTTLHNQFGLDGKDLDFFVQKAMADIDARFAAQNVSPPNLDLRQAGFGSPVLAPAPDAAATVVIQHLDRLSKIQAALQQARLDAARGDATANARIAAALRDEIAFDEKWIGVQEDLIKRGIGDIKAHTATINRLKDDEAAAFSELGSMADASAQAAKDAADKLATAAETFTLPMSLTIAAAKAATTATMTDDIKVAEQIRAYAKSVIASGKKRGQAIADAYAAIASANNTINGTAQSFAVPMKLQLAQAKASATSSTADDIVVAKKIRAYAEMQIKSHKLSIEEQIAAWNAIAQANSTIGDQTTGDPTPSYHMASTRDLTKGMRLSRNAKLALQANLAQKEAHGGMVPNAGTVGALGYPVSGGDHIEININGGDLAEVRRVITDVLRKERRIHAGQRSGRSGGLTLGIS